jgi:translation initiation factor 2 subunit 1
MPGPDLPEEGEHVVATVQSLRNFGAFVTLDEYNGREAFIHLSEVAAGWVKYIRDYVHEGQKIVARVIHVDHAKGQIDLSLKRINEHQRREKLLQWKNDQKAQKLLKQVQRLLAGETGAENMTFTDVLAEKYGSLYGAFEVASQDAKVFSKDNGKEAWVTAFSKVARENIVPRQVSVSGIVEISHMGGNGLVRVQEALAEAEKVAKDSITVQYVGAPRYRVTVAGEQYKNAEMLLKKAADAAVNSIKKAGGKGSFTHA